MIMFPKPGTRTGIPSARPILRDVALDDFLGFCDVMHNSQDRLLTLAWREAITELPRYSAMLEVIRSATSIFKTALQPEHGIVHRLARSTPPVQDLTVSISANNQTSISRLGVRGRRLGQRFLTCKHRGGTRFIDAAEINEAIRCIGWNATLVAANLAAYCEADEQSQFWGRGEQQGQLARHDMFSAWEGKAGESAGGIKEGVEELEMAVMGFAEKFGIVTE